MKEKLFNKYLVIGSILLLVVVGLIKIHSLYFVKEVDDWNYRNLQKVDRPGKQFTFTVFGDNKNSITTFNRLVEKVNNDNAIFAIDLGDLVFDGEKEKYKYFLNQISKFRIPLLTAIGNHEIREGGAGNYYNYFGRFYYSFTIGNSYFIVLDSSNGKDIDAWQMDWLKQELDRSQTYKNRFVFMHMPLYDPRQGGLARGHSLEDLDNAGQLNALFDKSKVTMVFASHIHAYYQGKWRNTPYIITGGGGAELAGSDPEHYFYHYVKANVDGDRVSYEVVKIESPDYELIDRWLHDAWIYTYAFVAIHYLDIMLVVLLLYLALYFILINEQTRLKKFLEHYFGKTK